MNVVKIIEKYYPKDSLAYRILLIHSQQVTKKALLMANKHPELNIDTTFVQEAGMLHDIGIYACNAPDLDCHGTEPYIKHGIIGAQLLRSLGLERHALVCERHTGTGLTIDSIKSQNLPLPLQDYSPQSIEEQLICYADKFYSKTHLAQERSPDEVRKSMSKFGEQSIQRINEWQLKFL
ncbi:MAG: HDIG domain-containing protein [Paludibacteraceae bacterium]|nr:HDIG domain-containing protein [Paludibacteraceae bacterium]